MIKKITNIHSTVPYLTFSKSGRGNITYKRNIIKRKLFKISILGSQTISVTFETQTLRNNDVRILELAKSNRVERIQKRESSNMCDMCECFMNCTVQIRLLQFFLLSKALLQYNRTLISSSRLSDGRDLSMLIKPFMRVSRISLKNWHRRKK